MKLKNLPSVDEVLKSPHGERWLSAYPRRTVLDAVRGVVSVKRDAIRAGMEPDVSVDALAPEIDAGIRRLASPSLAPVINATGIIIHTNLGRAPLCERALKNMEVVARGYSNLEFDLSSGKRGKRYAHIARTLAGLTGAEDAIAVNNNASAVLVALNTLARGREAIVSRGELVEIGGSFRVPDVMAASGAVLREVGTTNKTHLRDYARAINENTALILKVHQSNYRITGFTEDVPLDTLVALGRERGVPVMYDLGSGCLIDLRPLGIHTEPVVAEVVRAGADLITFSGDKLLGGPQAGLMVGKGKVIAAIAKNPMLRAVRIDKLTLSALEATLLEYADEEKARRNIPVLRMLLEPPESIGKRARRTASLLRKRLNDAEVEVVEDHAHAGGGSLPEVKLRTYAVAVKPAAMSTSHAEEMLRNGSPPVVARIREDRIYLDMRTVGDKEIRPLVDAVSTALDRDNNRRGTEAGD